MLTPTGNTNTHYCLGCESLFTTRVEGDKTCPWCGEKEDTTTITQHNQMCIVTGKQIGRAHV